MSENSEIIPLAKPFLKPVLDTPRKLKSFGRCLGEKYQLGKSQIINRFDLISMSAIEAANPSLNDWILNNPIQILDKETMLRDSTVFSEKILESEQFEHDLNELKNKLGNEITLSDSEIKLLIVVFFRDQKVGGKKILESKFGKEFFNAYERSHIGNISKTELFPSNRISDSRIFKSFFYGDWVPRIVKIDSFKDITNLIENDALEKLQNYLSSDFDQIEKSSNDRFEKSDVFNEYIRLIISRLWNLNSKYGQALLIAYGQISRRFLYEINFGFQSEKDYSANTMFWFLEKVFKYEQNIQEENNILKDHIKEILKSAVSDVWKQKIIYYLFGHGNTTEKGVLPFMKEQDTKFEDIVVEEIFKTHVEEISNRLKIKSENISNVFLPEISDAPLNLLWGWSNALGENKNEVALYLLRLFEQQPDSIELFLNNLLSPYPENPNKWIKNNLDLPIIPVDKLLEAIPEEKKSKLRKNAKYSEKLDSLENYSKLHA